MQTEAVRFGCRGGYPSRVVGPVELYPGEPIGFRSLDCGDCFFLRGDDRSALCAIWTFPVYEHGRVDHWRQQFSLLPSFCASKSKCIVIAWITNRSNAECQQKRTRGIVADMHVRVPE